VAGLPTTFTRRLGGATADFFYSGTFKRDDLTIGYIRIPNYAPTSQPVALQQLDREITFMSANTDGLIVDEMRNTGGLLCFGENIAARLIPYQFHATGFQLRATFTYVSNFYNSMIAAKTANAPANIIAQYETLYNGVVAANAQSRGLTDSLPVCTSSLNRDPNVAADGTMAAYQKPLMLLVDEFSTSTADSVAGMIQDAQRGLLFGMRTNAAGGTNTTYDAGPYSQGTTGMTLGLQVRKDYLGTPDFPNTNLIENVGVRPEIVDDYMTKANLQQNGAPFIHDFLEAMAAWIHLSK
jgi:C-terminal processing protease CtpA/Prc